jgi:hypothetical protein
MKNIITFLVLTLTINSLQSQQLIKQNRSFKWTSLSGDGINNPYIFKSANDYVSIPLNEDRWIPMANNNDGTVIVFAIYKSDFSSVVSLVQYNLDLKESKKIDITIDKELNFLSSQSSSDIVYFYSKADDLSNSLSIKQFNLKTNSIKDHFKIPNLPSNKDRLIGSYLNYLIIGNKSTGKFNIYDIDSKKNIRTLTISHSNYFSNGPFSSDVITFDKSHVFVDSFKTDIAAPNSYTTIYDLAKNKVVFSEDIPENYRPLIESGNIYWHEFKVAKLPIISTVPFPKLPDVNMIDCFSKDQYIQNDFFECSYDFDVDICCLNFSKGSKYSTEEFSNFKNYFELVLGKRDEILKSNENNLKYIGDENNIYISVLPKIDGIYLTKKQKAWFDSKLIDVQNQMEEAIVHNNRLKNNLKNSSGIALYNNTDRRTPIYYFENVLMIYPSDEKQIITVRYNNGTEKKFSLSTMKFLDNKKSDF